MSPLAQVTGGDAAAGLQRPRLPLPPLKIAAGCGGGGGDIDKE